jgi:FkbM family methyltransferase
MLISFEEINKWLQRKKITVTGALHLGAHECEELPFYHSLGLKREQVVWVDAIPANIARVKQWGIPNVYQAVITDKDDEEVVFHISNNVQSSSVLEFQTHAHEHPQVFYVDEFRTTSVTLDTFLERNQLDASHYTFWNMDIQGAELMALKGAPKAIRYAKALYLEVNERELYKGCGQLPELDAFLASLGFQRVLIRMTPHGWGDALYLRDA